MIYDRSHTGSPLLPPQPLHSVLGLVMAAGRDVSVTRAHGPGRAGHGPPWCRSPVATSVPVALGLRRHPPARGAAKSWKRRATLTGLSDNHVPTARAV